jgi:hypothetical protein
MARRRRRRHNFPRAQGSTSARGYGSRHQAERKRWEPVVESGYTVCVRCGFPIVPGTRWHLDHRDDALGYLGVSHARCNLHAAAKKGNVIMRARKAVGQVEQRGLLDWLSGSPSREW